MVKSHSSARLLAITRHSSLGELLGPMNDLEACPKLTKKKKLRLKSQVSESLQLHNSERPIRSTISPVRGAIQIEVVPWHGQENHPSRDAMGLDMKITVLRKKLIKVNVMQQWREEVADWRTLTSS